VFIVLNVLVTGVVLLILTVTVKPQRWIPWAVVIAAGIQTVITSPISLTPLNDTDVLAARRSRSPTSTTRWKGL